MNTKVCEKCEVIFEVNLNVMLVYSGTAATYFEHRVRFRAFRKFLVPQGNVVKLFYNNKPSHWLIWFIFKHKIY